jgi:hypothetical protein
MNQTASIADVFGTLLKDFLLKSQKINFIIYGLKRDVYFDVARHQKVSTLKNLPVNAISGNIMFNFFIHKTLKNSH